MFQLRNELGAGNTLIDEMKRNPDHNKYFNFFRMEAVTFNKLFSLLKNDNSKSDLGREPISPEIRLAITLRYLASGNSMVSLSYLFRVGKSTISNIITETLIVIWKILKPLVLAPPTEEKWLAIASGYGQWNFPNCIGAIDGKHVTIQAPPHAGSSYYNYKGSHSIVLMAVVDCNYRFVLVDVGGQGRQSDGVAELCLGYSTPLSDEISDGRPPFPYVIVGDEAFPLLENLMRPYPGRSELDITHTIYNYRHSRARRISENAFGMLASLIMNVHVYHYKLDLNYILDHYGKRAQDIRDNFRTYFNEEGAFPWQWNIL
ncbi:hypothetical protein NQ318_023539 [Aromia moschata]|uniref:DDE Tnp4 domain-containing protein n=1 Tax=Aromia moschata TaxID=1265417 RepID=A0AAV8YRY6_9CUCU|nr:hypothetical protein NQ318_023539 [Aromia moschata]